MKYVIALTLALILNASANLMMKAGMKNVEAAGGVLRDGLPSGIKIVLFRMMGVGIGKNVHISACVFLDGVFPRLIELKDGCMLGAGSKILTHENTTQGFRVGRVSVGHDSVVGAFSIVRSGVTLGHNVTTGIGSIVLKDIPDDRVAIGNPARIVKSTRPQERP